MGGYQSHQVTKNVPSEIEHASHPLPGVQSSNYFRPCDQTRYSRTRKCKVLGFFSGGGGDFEMTLVKITDVPNKLN